MTNLDQIVWLRARIARLGEKDLFSWWDSDAGTDAGLYILGQLFPGTAAWVSMQMAIECARVRHGLHLPHIPTVNLFNLDPLT